MLIKHYLLTIKNQISLVFKTKKRLTNNTNTIIIMNIFKKEGI